MKNSRFFALFYVVCFSVNADQLERELFFSDEQYTEERLIKMVKCKDVSSECVYKRLSQAFYLLDFDSNKSKLIAFNSISLSALYFNENKNLCPIAFDLVLLKFYAKDVKSNYLLIKDRKYIDWIYSRNSKYILNDYGQCGIRPQQWEKYKSVHRKTYCELYGC